jgi:hypothetical protein
MESELIPSPPLFTLQNSGDGEAAEEEEGEGEREGRASVYSGEALHCSREQWRMKQQKKEKEKEKEKGKAAPLFLLFFSLFEAAPLFTVETGKQQKKKEKEKEKKGRPRLCFCSSLSFRPRFCLHKNRKQPGTSSSTLSPKPEREAEEKRIQKAKRKGRLD